MYRLLPTILYLSWLRACCYTPFMMIVYCAVYIMIIWLHLSSCLRTWHPNIVVGMLLCMWVWFLISSLIVWHVHMSCIVTFGVSDIPRIYVCYARIAFPCYLVFFSLLYMPMTCWYVPWIMIYVVPLVIWHAHSYLFIWSTYRLVLMVTSKHDCAVLCFWALHIAWLTHHLAFKFEYEHDDITSLW